MLQLYSTFYIYDIDLIKPAVQGTLGMLRSALKNGYACIASPKYMRIYIDFFIFQDLQYNV